LDADYPLRGSSFHADPHGSRNGQAASQEVRYLQTTLGLNYTEGADAKIWSMLTPVREIFEFADLGFDDLLQRDIDDARVANELIPYVLSTEGQDAVRLFPPIVVVVMPITLTGNRPADRYPPVRRETVPLPQADGYAEEMLTSGPAGGEVFRFKSTVQAGKPIEGATDELALCASAVRLIVVDGQHRAMSLLALHRNLQNDWGGKGREAWRDFYQQWPRNVIEQSKLDELQLPAIFCTVPELSEGSSYGGSLTMKSACRSIFLTLNKTARRVSESRNRLLDDGDLIAVLMRQVLKPVKDLDTTALTPLRIWNVELDQGGSKLSNPVSLTGVNHLFYALQRTLLDEGDIGALTLRGRTNYGRRSQLTALLERVDPEEVAVAGTARSRMTRFSFDPGEAERIFIGFDARYGQTYRRMLEEFGPYWAHARAALLAEANVRSAGGSQVHAYLFEGQGFAHTFDEHRRHLEEKAAVARDAGNAVPPAIADLQATASGLEAQVNQAVTAFREERARNLLDGMDGKGRVWPARGVLDPAVRRFVDSLYGDVLLTVAFQAAVFCGGHDAIELAYKKQEARQPSTSEVETAFGSLLADLTAFFRPARLSGLQKLAAVFQGPLEQTPQGWEFRESRRTFRRVVFEGMMTPDNWPYYRYIVIELWRSAPEPVQERIALTRRSARAAVWTNLKRRRLKERAEILSTRADRLENAVEKKVLDEAFADYSEFIKGLGGVTLNFAELESGASDIEASAVSAPLVEGVSGEVEISQDADAEVQGEDPTSFNA
jgi:hypothetical protein